MQDYIRKRAVRIGLHIVTTSDTVRQAADVFGISKTTIHKDISVRLPKIHKNLSITVNNILSQHKAERHINGGEATRQKYRNIYSAERG